MYNSFVKIRIIYCMIESNGHFQVRVLEAMSCWEVLRYYRRNYSTPVTSAGWTSNALNANSALQETITTHIYIYIYICIDIHVRVKSKTNQTGCFD